MEAELHPATGWRGASVDWTVIVRFLLHMDTIWGVEAGSGCCA